MINVGLPWPERASMLSFEFDILNVFLKAEDTIFHIGLTLYERLIGLILFLDQTGKEIGKQTNYATTK